jgi:hypothetical protein
MGTIRVRGVRLRIYPKDHKPLHVHGYYGEAFVVVEVRTDGTVMLAARGARVIPRNAKRSDVQKIVKAAAEAADEIVAEWERMQA